MRDNVRNSAGRATASDERRRLAGVVARVRIGCIIGRTVERVTHIACSGMMEEPGSEARWMVVQSAQATAAWDNGYEWKS